MTSKVSHVCQLPGGLSKRDHTIVAQCVVAAFATDKRSHAWIRIGHSSQGPAGRNHTKGGFAPLPHGCREVVADSAHSPKPLINPRKRRLNRRPRRPPEMPQSRAVPGPIFPAALPQFGRVTRAGRGAPARRFIRRAEPARPATFPRGAPYSWGRGTRLETFRFDCTARSALH